MYKETVGVPPLAMIDDLVAVTPCGVESVVMSSFLNSKANVKKLQFGINKCHKIHVGKEKRTCPDLYLDEWIIEAVDHSEAGGQITLEEVQNDEQLVEEVSEERYLGDIISKDGKNTQNVKARAAKANGTINQIMSILEDICFGKYYFQVAVILRNSMLINSLLFNAEAWYNVTDNDLKELEKADEILLRKILECPVTTPKEMLYLELACLPVKFIIMGRSTMFLQYLLKQESDSLLHTFFKAQLDNPTKKDWCQSAKDTLEELGLKITLSQMKLMTEEDLKEIVKKACETKALEYLNKKKESHSKVLHLAHNSWGQQPYLKPNQMTAKDAKFIFLLRTRMLDVKLNFRNKYNEIKCPNCKSADDDQEHLLYCSQLEDGQQIVDATLKYEDIFFFQFGKNAKGCKNSRSQFQGKK